MITLATDRQIGPVLRQLRRDAGITIRQLADLTHISKSGVVKRERSSANYLATLIDTTSALGYDLALIPKRHPGARPTGTGWPT